MSFPHIRTKPKSFWTPLSVLCLAILLAALLFFLLTEHTAHTLGALPFVIFLACPLIHLFMHRRHGHEGHGDKSKEHGQSQPSDRTISHSNATAPREHHHA